MGISLADPCLMTAHTEGQAKYQPHHSSFFFSLIARSELIKAASGAEVVQFSPFLLYSTSRLPCCLLYAFPELQGLGIPSHYIFGKGWFVKRQREFIWPIRRGTLTNNFLWDRSPSSFPSSLLEIYCSSSRSVQHREQINLQSCRPV